MPNTESDDTYLKACRERKLVSNPARFPLGLPDFFIRLLTKSRRDTVLDPFAGSNSTGFAAERLKRRWIAIEINRDYLIGSRFRFAGSIDAAGDVIQG